MEGNVKEMDLENITKEILGSKKQNNYIRNISNNNNIYSPSRIPKNPPEIILKSKYEDFYTKIPMIN